MNVFKNTGGPRNFPVLLIFCILTNAIQRTTARDEPTTTDTTATADRRSRDSSLITNILYLAWKCLHSPDDVFCLFIKNIFLPYIWPGNMQLYNILSNLSTMRKNDLQLNQLHLCYSDVLLITLHIYPSINSLMITFWKITSLRLVAGLNFCALCAGYWALLL